MDLAAPAWIVLGPLLCGSIIAVVATVTLVAWLFVMRTKTASQREVEALREEYKRLREENERLKKKPTGSTDIKAI